LVGELRISGFFADLVIAFSAAACVGTVFAARDFAFGYDPLLFWQAGAAAALWLAPALAAVWLAEWLMARAARRLELRWDRGVSRAVLRPLLIGLICLAQPMLGYAEIGTSVLLLAAAAALWRWWTEIGRSPRIKDWLGDLEERLGKISDGRIAAAIFVAALALYAVVIFGAFAPLPQPEGDEPHYLIISYSMLADGDVLLNNNYYENRDYELWHQGWIQAHTKKGINRAANEEFSMHTAGLPAYLLPFLAAGLGLGGAEAIHLAVRLGMALPAAALVAILYLCLSRLFGRRRSSVGIALLAGATCPVLFFSYHVFTELPAATLCLLAFYVLWRERSPGWAARVLTGLALGALPWLGAKYFALAAPFAVLWLVKELRWGWSWSRAAAVAAPGAILGALFLWHTFSMFGTVNPSAYYVGAGGSIFERTPVFRVSHASGLLEAAAIAGKTGLSYWVDQREGLLAYAPWYLLGVAGWFGMASSRRWRATAWALCGLVTPFLLLYCLTGFNGGHSPPARAMTAMIWAALIPAAWLIGKVWARARELTFALILLSLVISFALLTHPAFLYHDFHVRASHLLAWLSTPFLDATALAPSVNSRHFEYWGVTAVWLAALSLALVWLVVSSLRKKPASRRWSGAGAVALAAVAAIWAAGARTPPLEDGRFEPAGTEYSLWFERGEVYADPQAFWVRTGAQEWCYVVSRHPVGRLSLRLRSLTPNSVRITSGGGAHEVRLVERQPARVEIEMDRGFGWGGRWVSRFGIESRGGVAEGSDILPGDGRALGVEVSVLPRTE